MFWKFGGYANISAIDSILDKPDVSIEELLDESDLIQELKQQNSKLLEFLREEPVLRKLLNYVVAERPGDSSDEERKRTEHDASKSRESSPLSGGAISFFGKGKARSQSKSQQLRDGDGDSDLERREAQRKKYAYVSCEVLASEIWSITEALMEQQDHLRTFWQYLYQPAPLDPLQAGYFTKVNETLFDKQTQKMLSFFASLEGIVPAMLQHVDCPMIMDLLLKIISLEKHEHGAGIVDWLQSQDLVTLLLRYLSPEHSSATQTSAGDFLKAIITISANATTQDQSVIGPNELTRQLVSEASIKSLIEDMLRGGNALTVGVGIVIEVIRKNNSDYDLENQIGPEPKTSDPIYLGTLLRQFAINVPNFMHLIRSKSASKPDLKAASGGIVEPLGFDRFKTCELMAELLHCSNMVLLNERGAEDEVRKRDAERERLKLEGRLSTPRAPLGTGAENSFEEFGSSVDSQGFHHAERPSDAEMDGKPEETRRLEVQNVTDEDEFEKVNAPSTDDLPTEVTFDDFNDLEQPEHFDSMAHVGSGQRATSPDRAPFDADVPKPLSPTKRSRQVQTHFDPPPSQAAESPTSADVTERIDKLDVDEDTVMTEFGEDPSGSDDDDEPSELEREFARHIEESRPAPLFSRKQAADSDTAGTQDESEDQPDIDHSTATLQGTSSSAQAVERAPYETEADNSPVVGDLLKIQFVEHQVVPTILDFFFRFPWNNFLHNVVYDVVQQVFSGTLERGYNRTLAFDLFTEVKPRAGLSIGDLGLISSKDITDRILDGQKASDVSQSERGMRLGYMGHLTLIAEEVCKFGSRSLELESSVIDRVNSEDWIRYVEGTLSETRDRDNAVLGGVRPQDSMGVRSTGLAGGVGSGAGNAGIGAFTASTTMALANAGLAPQDSSSLADTTGMQGLDAHSNSQSSRFGGDENDDGDDRMHDDESDAGAGSTTIIEDETRGGHFSDDEQYANDTKLSEAPQIPQPLAKPPSRARRQLAERLAMRKRASESSEGATGSVSSGSEEPSQVPRGPERFSALFSSGSDDDEPGSVSNGNRYSDAPNGEHLLEAQNTRSSPFDHQAAGSDSRDLLHQADSMATDTNRSNQKQSHAVPDVTQPNVQETGQTSSLRHRFGNEYDSPSQKTYRHNPLYGQPVDPEDTSSSDDDELVEIRPRRTA